MPSLLFCGPKMAACGIVISIWGVIMLVMLGIFFSAKSAVLIEDVPFTEEDIRNETPRGPYMDSTTRWASTASSQQPFMLQWGRCHSARFDSTSARSTW
uniref:Uncharacterized protein n=1 Tax=Oncorhynchus tshawytscha TaxID=74940 RepID=A0A8C8HDL1_ONCTS